MTLLALPPAAGRTFGPGLTAKVDLGQSPDFSVFQGDVPPGADGPPPHVHRVYDEAFYVLSGSMLFISDGSSQECPTGSFVFVPRGTAHGFANPGTTTASVLVITSARAIELIDRTYDLLDAEGRPTDLEALLALYAEHDTEILGPPPTS